MIEFRRVYAKPGYPLTSLRKLTTLVQYGTSVLASEQEVGLPVLRMNNLQNEGWDLSDLKYVDLPSAEAETYRLESGDILFNRTNSKELVGKCEVFHEDGHWVFASYLIRVRMDPTQAEPHFVSAFLNTDAGRIQINRVSRQIVGMTNINAEELRDLQIPLPPLGERKGVGEKEKGSGVELTGRGREGRVSACPGDPVWMMEGWRITCLTEAWAACVYSTTRRTMQRFHAC
ncbi:MAG: restriction endonuclease subunit S [Phycisphaerales bacterium]